MRDWEQIKNDTQWKIGESDVLTFVVSKKFGSAWALVVV
jgi:hypothetical protein